MTKRPRRDHSPEFKAKVALAAIRGERTLIELSQQFGVFGADAKAEPAAPIVEVKTLHAKIGELTLENDFLEGALNKAGLLSAKK